MSDQTLDMNSGIIWRPRIGRHGVYDVATNSENIRFKELVEALRNRGNKAYTNGWSLWLLPDGSPARRRLKETE
jgi:hypothetical protein